MPTLDAVLRCLDRELDPRGPLVAEVEGIVAKEWQQAFADRGVSLGSVWEVPGYDVDLIESHDFENSMRPGSADWKNLSRRTGSLSLQIEIANVHRKTQRGMQNPILSLWIDGIQNLFGQAGRTFQLDPRGAERSGFISPSGMAKVRAAIEARLTRCFREGA